MRRLALIFSLSCVFLGCGGGADTGAESKGDPIEQEILSSGVAPNAENSGGDANQSKQPKNSDPAYN